MSVVTATARRRWAVVAVGTALLVAGPALAGAAVSAATRPASVPAPQALLRRALTSASVPHRGLAESRGTLGLPDVRQFGDVAALLGSTTRERVWWQDAGHWRGAQLLSTGGQGVYAPRGGAIVGWGDERELRRPTVGAGAVPVPRVADPPPPPRA